MAKAIEVERLVKRYISFLRRGLFRREKVLVEALKGVSFDVNYGEVFGLLGPNGAGKTTTVKILSTLLIPDEGRARVAGFDVVESPSMVRKHIGVTLTVEKGFFWKLTGRENLSYFGMLRGLKGLQLRRRVDELMKMLGLDSLGASDKFYEEYSLGMRARLSLARALLTDPPVLILDEPTLGLDPSSARYIRKLLLKFAREDGKAILLTTHNMFEAEVICDRVAIIDKGRIIAIGTVQELKKAVARRVVINITASSSPIELKLLEAKFMENVTGEVSLRLDEQGKLRIRVVSKIGEEELHLSEVVKLLSSLGVRVNRVELEEPSLEDVFVALTHRRGSGVDQLDRRI
ncbi:MAG: ABC transporter [Candidatus Bathyarchaeota archaeon B24]|nr:MAG: ABC transporter [Candidatus Bathyarchaeota archaeon B24]RLI25254.1 MAG: ABC transporter ATP-binding protein [Candidatus Bathyarchaeota archaeon]